MPLASLVGGIVSGLFGQLQQRNYLQAQQKENLKAFQYNQALAQQQNAFNVAQWNRANNYNLPKNQVQRLKDAGLNPNLMYSNGTSGLTAVQSPSMSAGTPYQPVDYTMNGGRKTIGDTIANSLDMALKKAQVDNLNADSEKKKSEKEGQDIVNTTIFDTAMADIKSKLSQAGLNDAQTDKVSYEIQSIQKSIDVASQQILLWQSEINNMSVQQAQNWFSLQLQKNVSEAQIKDLCSSANLKESQAKEILKLLPSKLANLMANTELTNSQSKLAIANALLSAAQESGVLQENDIREVDRIMSLNITDRLGDSNSSLSNVAGAFGYAGKVISGLVPILSKIK